jgi:hypothetical protein
VADVPGIELVIQAVQSLSGVVQDDPRGLEGRRDVLEVVETLIGEPEMLEHPEQPALQLIELGRPLRPGSARLSRRLLRRIQDGGFGTIVRIQERVRYCLR